LAEADVLALLLLLLLLDEPVPAPMPNWVEYWYAPLLSWMSWMP
jgi:hypothetical protein